jgi:hypothetical protein
MAIVNSYVSLPEGKFVIQQTKSRVHGFISRAAASSNPDFSDWFMMVYTPQPSTILLYKVVP